MIEEMGLGGFPINGSRSTIVTAASTKPGGTPSAFATDDEKGQAEVGRDPVADGAFYHSVRTTGV
jgi:hypothetical protein